MPAMPSWTIDGVFGIVPRDEIGPVASIIVFAHDADEMTTFLDGVAALRPAHSTVPSELPLAPILKAIDYPRQGQPVQVAPGRFESIPFQVVARCILDRIGRADWRSRRNDR